MDAELILGKLREQGSGERAVREKAYLKSDFVHLGVPVPAIRRTVRTAVRSRPERDDLLELAARLWAATQDRRVVHEGRMAGVEVLVRWVDVLEPGDVSVVEGMVRESVSWVYVDVLADKVAGALVLRYPELGAVLDRWVGDSYMWVRRAALLALLPGVRAGEADLGRLSGFGDAVIGERDFFMRKALGWVLREVAKKDPAWVEAWVGTRVDLVSGVTLREAVRYLSPGAGKDLLQAYRTR